MRSGGRAAGSDGTRTSLPFKPYVRHGDEERAAEVEALVAELRDRLSRGERPVRPAVPSRAGCPEPQVAARCDECGYLLTAPGHLLECGDGA
jgi:hypothetical protein